MTRCLAATVIAELVHDHFVALVLRSLTVGPPDPKGLIGEICAALAGYPERVLKLAAEHLTAERKKLVAKKKDALDAIAAISKGAMLRLTPESPSSPAWLVHHRAGRTPHLRRFHRTPGRASRADGMAAAQPSDAR